MRHATLALTPDPVLCPAAARTAPLPRSCINVLLELIQTKVNYVVQESIIVIKDIFRCGVGCLSGR